VVSPSGSGTSFPARRCRYSAARASIKVVAGTVKVRNTAINTSCSAGPSSVIVKYNIDARTTNTIPIVAPKVGPCMRW